MPIKQFVNSKPKSSIIAVPEQGMKKHDFIDDFKDYYVHLLGRDENFFLFGLTEEQIVTTRDHYDPVAIISQDEELQQAMHLLEFGHFNQFEPGLFDDLINSIKSPHGPWMTIADFRSFVDTQKRVEDLIAPMACLCVAHRQAICFFTSYRYFSFFL